MFQLGWRESQLLGCPLRELGIGLVEDHRGIILGGFPHFGQQALNRVLDVFEISRLTGESAPMLRIFLIFPTPEIRGICHIRKRAFNFRQGFLTRADQVCSSASSGSVF